MFFLKKQEFKSWDHKRHITDILLLQFRFKVVLSTLYSLNWLIEFFTSKNSLKISYSILFITILNLCLSVIIIL
jgi:hypothetical protein